METAHIPKVVNVASSMYAGTYTSTKEPSASTWSWYPPAGNRDTWPHITVGDGDDIEDEIRLTDFKGGTSKLKKLWWYKLHVSIPLEGTNLHLFYQIDTNWRVRPCGHNMRHIPSHKQDVARGHLNRGSSDYKKLAQGFVEAARAAWKASLVSNVNRQVGPQTAASFNDGSGL